MTKTKDKPAAGDHSVVLVPRKRCVPDETNPRDDLGELGPLTESLKVHGILHALVGYRERNKIVIVIGRRRLAAAEHAGLDMIPVRIVSLDEGATLEAQIAENQHRAHIHPMAEAAAYERLIQKHFYTISEVAQVVGEPVSYVRRRCKLLALAPAVRKMFRQGKFTAEVAFELARIAHPTKQTEAAKVIAEGGYGGPFTARDARDTIRARFFLALESAPFDVRDANLVKTAGACTDCPKRSTNQGELFDDFADDDLCLDATCHANKVKADWSRQSKLAKKAGMKVASAQDSKKLFPYGNVLGYDAAGKYVLGTDTAFEFGQKKTYAELLEGADVQPTLAKDDTGAARTLYPRKAAHSALRKMGYKKPSPKLSKAEKADKEARKRQRAEKRLRQEVAAQVAEQAATKFRGLPVHSKWRALALAARANHSALERTAKRRGVEFDKLYEEITDKAIKGGKADQAFLQGFVCEQLLWENYSDHAPYGAEYAEVARLLGFDLADIEAEQAKGSDQ